MLLTATEIAWWALGLGFVSVTLGAITALLACWTLGKAQATLDVARVELKHNRGEFASSALPNLAKVYDHATGALDYFDSLKVMDTEEGKEAAVDGVHEMVAQIGSVAHLFVSDLEFDVFRTLIKLEGAAWAFQHLGKPMPAELHPAANQAIERLGARVTQLRADVRDMRDMRSD